MKKNVTTLFALLLLSNLAMAKIWRVNNNSGITADFTTLQAAHDGATSGDTIHLEPSLTTYGNLTMTKKLAIISTGQFNSLNPGFQADPKEGFCNSITINAAAANGSVISVRYTGHLIASTSTVSNITFINCASIIADTHWCDATGRITISDADNCFITKCWATNISIQDGANNIVVNNNLIGNGLQVTSNSSAIVSQNVISASNNRNDCGVVAINNSQVSNNIFNKPATTNSFPNSNVQNNISSGTNLPAGNGNVNSVDMSTVFVNHNGGFGDNYYQLKAGSPAIAAGVSGEDLGAFGGSSPFKLAVQPSIPSIYKLQVPATPSGNSMNIIFSTKSN